MSRARVVQRLAGDRPVPDLVTEIPGPKARAHVEFDETWTSPSLPRAYPIVPVRGDGLTIEDIDGNLFLDFAAGIAVNSTGHAHPAVVGGDQGAGRRPAPLQRERLLPADLRPDAASGSPRIAPVAGGRARAFLGNSATEAVEAAIKLARYATRRPYVVAFLGAFHGRTLRRGQPDRVEGEVPRGLRAAPARRLPRAVRQGRRTCAGSTRSCSTSWSRPNEVAAIIVEPIQGEGGYIVPEDGFLQGLRELCDRHGILLVADEVQSGAGRTGKMWAIEHWGVKPDILLTAKGIATGMPLGALIARADCSRAGAPAPTARRTAATRSPAPRRWRRSTCSRAASSRTPGSAATQAIAGLRRLRGRHPAARHATSAARA